MQDMLYATISPTTYKKNMEPGVAAIVLALATMGQTRGRPSHTLQPSQYRCGSKTYGPQRGKLNVNLCTL